MSKQHPLPFGESVTPVQRKKKLPAPRSTPLPPPVEGEMKTWAFEVSLAPERTLELEKIFCDDNILVDKRWPAAEEAGRPYMAELQETTELYGAAAFVFWHHEDDGCIRTSVFHLSKNDFRMDWRPGGPKTDAEFGRQLRDANKREIEEKTGWMGVKILRWHYEPLGVFAITLDCDDEDVEPEELPIIWRFARPPATEEMQDFLQVVAEAFQFAGFVRKGDYDEDYCEDIDFWKREDGRYCFHFTEVVPDIEEDAEK